MSLLDGETHHATELPDLSDQREVERLVQTFYAQVAEDDLLGPVFTEEAQVTWDKHIATLTAFWSKVLLGKPGFQGAPTQKHSVLSRVQPFRAEQFERWVDLFHRTVDGGWAGPFAEAIKARAVAIARMQSRLVLNAEPWGEDLSSHPPAPIA